jgi:ABC-type glycerol-3-phosphate transport system substrate-binding protein
MINRIRTAPRRLCAIAAGAIALLSLFSGCGTRDNGIAIIWTDQADFASYTELFNKSQSRYKVIVVYKENPAEALIDAKELPDIVIGPWLKGEKTRRRLIPVDYLFNEFRVSSKQFYQPLLDLGNVHGHQYLLPVSFNLPALIFSPENKIPDSPDTSISLDQVQNISYEYNRQQKGIYTRMGFSPRWESEFLYFTSKLFDANFEEGTPLFKWNDAALKKSVAYLRDWTRTINTSTTAEDDFEFKYLYDPPYKLVTGGRNLFSYLSSADLFVLPHDKIQNIDFRWVAKDGKTPVKDNIIYAGICRNARHIEGAEAFLSWFFSEKTQKELLERNRAMGIMDRSFGISGGFSAIVAVNEKSFPLYYPSLLGHLPASNSLDVPRILPNNWELIKKEIVIPWLEAAVSAPDGQEDSVSDLNKRIGDWVKTH